MADDARRRAASKKIEAVIDRIEDGGIAILVFGDEAKATVDFPVALLPEGASDGDHLRIAISLDSESRATAEDRVRAMQERLEKRGGAQEQKDFKL